MTLKLPGSDACVFDAYGTLFDVNSSACAARTLWESGCSRLQNPGGRSSGYSCDAIVAADTSTC